jgi:pyruvate dehydrogenase E2 component (dihydrolipoamide acetyltransferase)
MSVFVMPSLGADMEAATLVEWLVRPGDTVARGDVVAVVETQKGAIEVEVFEAGTVAELIAVPGQTLPVGAPMARLAAPGGADDRAAPPAPPPAAPTAPALPPAPPPRAEPPEAQGATGAQGAPEAQGGPGAPMAAGTQRGPGAQMAPPAQEAPDARTAPGVQGEAGAQGAAPAAAAPRDMPASPAARARAAAAGVELAAVAGTGPGGAVLLADVERQAATTARPPRRTGPDMAEMRRAIAAAMTRANREIPHFYLSHRIDLQAAADWLAAENARRTPDRRLLIGALLVRATVRALAAVPELNGRFEDDAFMPSAAVHCGVAVALRGGGLVAPAILDAQDCTLDAIMAAMRDLVTRTRAGRLRTSELTRGTITVSSLGEGGVDALLGVIHPPQVALVGFGTPRPQPMVRDGAVVARLAVTVTLAADHRVSDGRRGATFLSRIDHLLQEPETA